MKLSYKQRKIVVKIMLVLLALVTVFTAIDSSYIYNRRTKGKKRWRSNVVKVYIDPNITQDLQDGYLIAIDNWNKNLKNVQFKMVEKEKNSNVFLSATTYKGYKTGKEYRKKDSNWIGITDFNTDLGNFFTKTYVYYNLDLYKSNLINHQDLIIQIAEHELGHVLGLEHDNNFEHRSVMATGGVSNRLSESDFEKVDILYGDNPYSYYNPFYKPSEEVRNGLYY